MTDDIGEILLTEEEISETVSGIAAEIDRDYADCERKLLLLAVLKGSVVFMGDLMKALSILLLLMLQRVGMRSISCGSRLIPEQRREERSTFCLTFTATISRRPT